MTPNQTINPAVSEPVPDMAVSASLRGPGLQIRTAREAASMSIEVLAQQTKLAKPTLDALERDDFTLLNEPVYIRGYYRKVAKALSIAERDLIAAYEAVVQQKGPPVPTKLLLGSGDNGPHRARRRSGWSWLLAIVLIGALLFIALRFVSHVPPPVVTVGGLSETLSSTESSPASIAPAPEISSSTSTALPSVSMSENSSASPTAPASTTAANSTTTTASPAKPVASAASTATNAAGDTPVGNNEVAAGTGLSLNFKATSWVRIEDTYGKVLLSGVMQAGTHQSIDGRRPLAVFLGNAPGVSATDAGKPINIAPYVKDNATARFTVP